MEKNPTFLEAALRLQEIERDAEEFAERVWKGVREEVGLKDGGKW